jgi:hypothetical protein
VLLFLIVASGLSAAPDEGTIKISTAERSVKAGSDVTIEVRDSSSARAAETGRGHTLRTGEDSPTGETYLIISSPMNIDVPPGGTIRREILINRLYDLSKPGKYTIQVERIIGSSSVVIKSNALPVTVEN